MHLRKYRYGTLLGRLSLDSMQAKDSSQMMQEFASRKPRVNPFLKAYHEDFAARADWCVKGYEDCNHNPVVTVSAPDLYAKPGETITLRASVKDVRPFTQRWWLYREASGYSGETFDTAGGLFSEAHSGTLEFTIPEDAKPGDYFNFVHIARNEHENPMTGYGQTIVHVC